MNQSQEASRSSVVIVGAKRTAFGDFGGALKALSATDLGVAVSKQIFEETSISPQCIDHVVFGNVIPSSSDAAYLARHIGLKSGVPHSTPAVTLNRLCGSGFEAIADGARRLRLEEASVVLVGGSENMSQAPFTLRKARFGQRMGHGDLEDTLVAGLYDSYAELPMALTAERLAEKYKLSREECDAFALRSHTLAHEANEKGFLRSEIAQVAELSIDEHVRKDSSLESLKKLKTVFKKDGVVTAGNASGICDGAAALVLTTETEAKKRQWPILATLCDVTVVGCDPKEMGIGPVPATQLLMKRNHLSQDQVRLLEVNEAFAAQALAVLKELKFPDSKVNTDGGAIAIGHPLAASGARLCVHLIHRLRSLGGGLGIATACIGGGQGMAVLLKVE